MQVTAVIIARGGSRRLPGKNLLNFHGRPLVAHKVHQLRQCRLVDTVVVGSDSQEILDVAAKESAQVVRRKAEFCDEVSRPWNDVIADMASKVHGDVILWAHCTNPCIRPQTYDRALADYLTREEGYDSLVGVTRLQSHLWFRGEPLNYTPGAVPHPVAAQLEPVYWQNGGIFIMDRQAMLDRRYVIGDRPLLFEVSEDEAVDIDTEEDYRRAVSAFVA